MKKRLGHYDIVADWVVAAWRGSTRARVLAQPLCAIKVLAIRWA